MFGVGRSRTIRECSVTDRHSNRCADHGTNVVNADGLNGANMGAFESSDCDSDSTSLIASEYTTNTTAVWSTSESSEFTTIPATKSTANVTTFESAVWPTCETTNVSTVVATIETTFVAAVQATDITTNNAADDRINRGIGEVPSWCDDSNVDEFRGLDLYCHSK